MAKEAVFVQIGDTIDYANSGDADIAVGDVVPLVSRIGVALENIAQGEVGGVRLVGVFEMPAEAGVDLTFAVGDLLYWDATNSVLTKTETGNTPAGMAVSVKAATEATALVRIG